MGKVYILHGVVIICNIEYPHQVQGWNTGLCQLVTFYNLHSETVIYFNQKAFSC